MQIAILTLFKGLSTSYSLVNVVADHIKMLLNHNFSVKILVSEECPINDLPGIYSDSRLTWCFVTNTLNDSPIYWKDYLTPSTGLHATFNDELNIIIPSLLEHLSDVTICMLHDILYQGRHYIHNIAIRQVAQHLTHLKFISFTHSVPLTRPVHIPNYLLGFYSPMPRTLYAYPTHSGIPLLAKQYNVPENLCRAVYNTLDPFAFLCPEVYELHQSVNLLDTDLLIIYPCRLTPAKQCEKIIELVGSISTYCDRTVKVVFCDFPCLDISPEVYKSLILKIGQTYSLSNENIIFTSDYNFPAGFPRRAVLDLFTLSNLFICPSYSESFGLTVLEAASRGNFLVLNQCVPALEELGEKLHAYFLEWPSRCSDITVEPVYPQGPQSYYKKHSQLIMQQLLVDRTIFAKNITRTHYNPNWIWYHQLFPLISHI